jgi:hypothetical protein
VLPGLLLGHVGHRAGVQRGEDDLRLGVLGEDHHPVAGPGQLGDPVVDPHAVQVQVEQEHVGQLPAQRVLDPVGHPDQYDAPLGVGGDPRMDALPDHRMIVDDSHPDRGPGRRLSAHSLILPQTVPSTVPLRLR